MGTPAKVSRVGLRNNRAGATRGVTAETPLGWSVPEPAERLASFAKAMGWEIQSKWVEDENRRTHLWIELGRLLYPGENKAAKGDRWIYRLMWSEVPDEDRPNGHHNKMKLTVNRALTPTSNKWQDGPSLKMITDLVGRHPVPVKHMMSARAAKLKADNKID